MSSTGDDSEVGGFEEDDPSFTDLFKLPSLPVKQVFSEPLQFIVVQQYAVVREKPNLESKFIATLHAGEKVSITQIKELIGGSGSSDSNIKNVRVFRCEIIHPVQGWIHYASRNAKNGMFYLVIYPNDDRSTTEEGHFINRNLSDIVVVGGENNTSSGSGDVLSSSFQNRSSKGVVPTLRLEGIRESLTENDSATNSLALANSTLGTNINNQSQTGSSASGTDGSKKNQFKEKKEYFGWSNSVGETATSVVPGSQQQEQKHQQQLIPPPPVVQGEDPVTPPNVTPTNLITPTTPEMHDPDNTRTNIYCRTLIISRFSVVAQ